MDNQSVLYDLGLTGDLLDDLGAQGIYVTYHSNQLGDEWVTIQQGEVKLSPGDEGYKVSVIATINNLSQVVTLVKALAATRIRRGIREKAIQQFLQAFFMGTWDADDQMRVKRVWFEDCEDGSTIMWLDGPGVALVFPPEWTIPEVPPQVRLVLEQHLAEYQARRKTMNRGNSGHRGYTMRKITAIEAQGEQVMIRLECGHERRIFPYLGRTAEQYAIELQQGMNPFVIGKTRLRCGERHG